MEQEILRFEHITKTFGRVKALDDVSFSCRAGEVMVLAGENGAGKSTILKILSGLYHADSGQVWLKGERVEINCPLAAQALGIAMVYQELTLINEMSVLDNIFLTLEPVTRLGRADKRTMRRQLAEIMERYGLILNPDAIVRDLSVAEQQMVEITKILMRNPEIIIFDESTSALGKEEVEKLRAIINSMKREGKSIIFISHRMEEVFDFGDRVTVLKDGKFVGVKDLAQTNSDELIRMMVGRPLQNVFPEKTTVQSEETVFEVKDLHISGVLNHISFRLKKNEILGIAGLQGHGQTELFNAIYGLIPNVSGELYLHGERINPANAKRAIQYGLALVPSDRKREGLFLRRSIRENLAILSLGARKKAGVFIDEKKEKRFAEESTARLSVRMDSLRQNIGELSGGNQQKVVLGKELAINPKLLLFNEPTRGIDVETKCEFYKIMHDLAAQGIGVIMCSSDLTEVIGMSNRVLVMYEGSAVAMIEGAEITEENIMRCAYGSTSAQAGGSENGK